MKFELQIVGWFRAGTKALAAILLSSSILLSVPSVLGAQVATSQASAVTNWLAASSAFRQAGSWIADGKHQQARAGLSSAATNLPAPYGQMAGQFLTGLDKALKPAPDSDKAAQIEALVELCSSFGSWEAATRLKATVPKAASPDDESDDPLLAWRLIETGKTEAAVAAYERKLAEERITTFKDYYKKQIDLIKRRPANLTNAQFSLELIREHYLKGYEGKADLFGSLRELHRVLPVTQNPKDALEVYRMVIQCLTSLGDLAGRDAWEDKTLRDFKSDPEACAEVHLNRGIRAYSDKNYEPALALFRKVCVEYPSTLAYGDAQYDIGSVFQDQKKYDQAIEEYNKLFSSNVNDYRLTPGTSEDYRNYRHKAAIRISECYEAKEDYAQALQFAEMAMNQYKPLSWCGTCLDTAKGALERRIKKLQETASKAK